MTTTPNEFLQFAKEMGLEQMKSTTTTTTTTTNGYSLTGLSVLNNLCYLIEQIHTLKTENAHLRSHLELVKQVEQYLSTKTIESKTLTNNNNNNHDEDKSLTLSPTNSLKNKTHQSSTTLSTSSRERQGVDVFTNNPDESSSMIHLETDLNEHNFNASSWNRVRHALKFSLRRKPHIPMNSSLTIPAISISLDSDDDRLHEKKSLSTKTETNHHDETDDESFEFNRLDEKRQSYRTNRANSSSNDYNLPVISTVNDDDNLSSTKSSKIAHYRRKIRSKLSTVRKQFSEQNSSVSIRHQLSPFDDLNINHALLSAKLAPAMTKSYQQKMRDWQTMQKSHFLVNYRRQSVIPKSSDLPLNSYSTLLLPTNQSEKSTISSSCIELEKNFSYINPILSPHQRSLIAYQWREIMTEEISLRYYNQYIQQKLQELKQLENKLKYLKTSIFCTKNHENLIKQRSMSNVESFEQYRENSFQQRRCQSLQTFVSMPASWLLAVQSAAYSDILDGTSMKTTDRTMILNRTFFDQLNHFKLDRMNFQRDTFKNFHLRIDDNSNVNHHSTIRTRPRTLLTRGHLRRFSLTLPKEFSFPIPQTPCQILTPQSETSSHIDLLNPNENDSHLLTSSSALTLNKRLKRSRFDLKKTLQRSKSMCMTQLHSWFHRNRQQPPPPRRKSAVESKHSKDYLSSPLTEPKLLGSPRLARLHQRIFKSHQSPPPPPPPPSDTHLLSSSTTLSLSQISDDSDRSFKKQESPVRIYLPARPSSVTRHVQISNKSEIPNLPSMPKITSPIINRRNLSSRGQERRDSFVTLSSIINNNNNQ